MAQSADDGRAPRGMRLRRMSSAPSGSTVPPIDEDMSMSALAEGSLVGYRSSGLGVFGTVLRYAGMPLEKFALFLNSSQVSGAGQMGQALRLTFAEGWLAPFRVVGPASLTAWFFQYAAMGLIFESVDIALSKSLGIERAIRGPELMEKPDPAGPRLSNNELALTVGKALMAPTISGSIESCIANRAEVQRYFGLQKFAELPKPSAFNKLFGHAFAANAGRNLVMSSTSFVVTPFLYKHYFPQEKKSITSLFWFGLGMNIFWGNVIAINLQALWGRSLDQFARDGALSYRKTISEGLRKEGVSAFITPQKWWSRVLMNAPAQGTLPWFYNEILPKGEWAVRAAVRRAEGAPAKKA